jgi:hypothetical protein
MALESPARSYESLRPGNFPLLPLALYKLPHRHRIVKQQVT